MGARNGLAVIKIVLRTHCANKACIGYTAHELDYMFGIGLKERGNASDEIASRLLPLNRCDGEVGSIIVGHRPEAIIDHRRRCISIDIPRVS